MIDIKDALYNILHSRYGRDVRQSIHDGIYQINENANEAVQTAKAMGVGTDVSSPTSSSTGYVAGNLYLNNSTWDLWQCIGTDSWVNKGNIKGATGVKGADGVNYYIHIRYSDKYDGTGFTASPTASSEYMGVYYGTSQTAPTNKQDYQWTSYVGASGTSAYVHIMYSEYADGSNFVSVPTPLCKYIGFYSGSLSSPPANKSYYTWSEYVGKSGTGSGDMTAAEYAPSGVYGKVDNAINADNATNATNAVNATNATSATDATNAENLKKSDGTTVSADTITTKLSKVDTTDNLSVELEKKIDKPANATNGQVLTYNGTSNEWEAQDSKGGGSGTARVNVSGIPSGYSLYYYDVSDPSAKKPVSGTSVEVGFGTYRFYASNGSDNTSEKEVIVDTLKIYNISLKVIYAVHISMAESDPDNAVTFPSGYDNSDFSDNAYMDFSSGSFHYGDWANAFFMPRSCMLKFDGTVDYYLNEDDETKKEDGTASDVANINYGGNAMVEWGKIYFGFKGDADGNGYTFIVSDSPSEGLDCYCNIDANKNEIDHFYTPKYFGSNDSSNRLRSISGQSNYVSQTGTTELSHAKANGNGWSTECYGDWTLIKHLLVLMSKSLNTQDKYGYGRCSTSNSTAIGQGTMNGKGRFWGDSSQTNGVKIFGMENWYGNIWRRIEGYVTNSSGVQLVKMCYGTRDGSTADAYSTDGTGYVSMGTTSGTSGSGIQAMHVNDKCGVVPKALAGNTSPTTYFADGHWYNNSCYAFVGGSWGYGLLVGAFCSAVGNAVSTAGTDIGAAVSCKPLSA